MIRAFTRLLGTLLLLSAPAWALSRVGNGRILDESLGMQSEVPDVFAYTGALPREGLAFRSGAVLLESQIGRVPTALNLQIRIFGREFPEFASLDRAALHEQFVARPGSVWRELVSEQECVTVFQSKDSHIVQTLILWGPGKGIVILATAHPQSEQATREILKNLQLSAGACAW